MLPEIYIGQGQDIWAIRTLLPDTNQEAEIFPDDSYSYFLEYEKHDVKLALAMALETLATDTALVEKYFKTANFESDGTKTANFLLKRASDIRDRHKADQTKAEAEANANFFGTVEGPCPDVDDFFLF